MNPQHLSSSGFSCKELVYQEDRLKLYRYKPTVSCATPKYLLIIFALINRPSILDLKPECSLIEDLLKEGITVYMIEWGDPLPKDASLSLSKYVTGYIKNCVDVIHTDNNGTAPHLMGICQGGVLSLCYATLFPQTIQNLILLSTPVDFHHPETFTYQILKSIDVDLLGKVFGNIPGTILTQALLWLNPFKIMRQKFDEMERAQTHPHLLDKFIKIEKWALDCPDHPSKAFCEFIKKFYQENELVKGKLSFGKRRVDLKNLSMPVLNIVASNDSLVPAASSLALKKYVSPKMYKNRRYPGGHISLYVNDTNRQQIARDVDQWMERKFSNA